MTTDNGQQWHGTTILSVRKGEPASSSPATARSPWATRSSSRTPARCGGSATAAVIAGFAGATADAFTLFERLEAQARAVPGQLTARLRRARQGLAHRPLPAPAEAMMAVADRERLAGPDRHRRRARARGRASIGIGSGGALRARRGPRAARSRRTSTPKRSRAGRWRSPPRSASYTNRNIVVESLDEPDAFTTPRDRLRTRSLHRRPERRQEARSRSRCATAGAASSSRPELREEVLPKNILMIGPTGVRQDRDRAAPRQARAGAVRQGRGDQVHRGRLCRPRCRADHPRPRRDRRSHDPREAAQARSRRRRNWRPRNGCSSALVGDHASAETREKFRRRLRAGELDDEGDRDRGRRTAPACSSRPSISPACRARRWACSTCATCSARRSAARRRSEAG